MQASNTFIIAREGYRAVGISLGAFVLFTMLDCDVMQFLSLVAAGLGGWIYRNPERVVPYYQKQSIVSPADGVVSAIETVDECESGSGPCYRVEILSGYFDVSMLRAPIASASTEAKVTHGTRFSRLSPLAAKLNARAHVRFRAPSGETVVCEHMIEQSFDPIRLSVQPAAHLMQGGRYGAMVKGVTALYLPQNCRIALNVGETVRAGETLIGYFSTAAAS